MNQTGVVARLAVRELWISFRLLLVLVAFTGAGAIVALLPAPLRETMGRLALGLGLATTVAAAVAAWSMAEERSAGRAGWLVTRSLPRRTLLAGWFLALAASATAAVAVAGALGWLAAASVALSLEPLGYVSLLAGVGTITLAAVALGLLLGALLPARAAGIATVLVCAGAGVCAWLLPVDGSLLPGGVYAALADLAEPGGSISPGVRATGVGLASTAVLLVAGRAALERAEL